MLLGQCDDTGTTTGGSPHVTAGQFPSMCALLGDSVRSMSKGKQWVVMEALEKFNDEAGKVTRKI